MSPRAVVHALSGLFDRSNSIVSTRSSALPPVRLWMFKVGQTMPSATRSGTRHNVQARALRTVPKQKGDLYGPALAPTPLPQAGEELSNVMERRSQNVIDQLLM